MKEGWLGGGGMGGILDQAMFLPPTCPIYPNESFSTHRH